MGASIIMGAKLISVQQGTVYAKIEKFPIYAVVAEVEHMIKSIFCHVNHAMFA